MGPYLVALTLGNSLIDVARQLGVVGVGSSERLQLRCGKSWPPFKGSSFQFPCLVTAGCNAACPGSRSRCCRVAARGSQPSFVARCLEPREGGMQRRWRSWLELRSKHGKGKTTAWKDRRAKAEGEIGAPGCSYLIAFISLRLEVGVVYRLGALGRERQKASDPRKSMVATCMNSPASNPRIPTRLPGRLEGMVSGTGRLS